jgi:hypothetical protein
MWEVRNLLRLWGLQEDPLWMATVMRRGSVGTMSKGSSDIHNGSQNHSKEIKRRHSADRMGRTSSLISSTVEVCCVMGFLIEVEK